MSSYPGGKNGDGVYQRIINLMPPHKVYVEPFAGSAAVLRNKLPAPVSSIAIDSDTAVISMLRAALADYPNIHIHQENGIEFLSQFQADFPTTLYYLDPPYLLSTRAAGRKIYNHEMTEDDHILLLKIIKELHGMVMISGYRSALYDEYLFNWRREEFTAMTRGGPAVECVWCNFPIPLELHDYRYLGDNFRERERIKRKIARWKYRLRSQPIQERAALLAAIEELREEMQRQRTNPHDYSDLVESPYMEMRDTLAHL